jgi:hypothetical protein
MFIDDVLRKLDKATTHPPVMLRKQVTRLLFAEDLEAGTLTGTGLQRAMNCVQEFCKEWKMKINVKKTKIVVNSIILWDVTPRSLLSCNRRFGGTYRLQHQGRRNNFSKNQQVSRWQAECSSETLVATQQTTRRHIP